MHGMPRTLADNLHNELSRRTYSNGSSVMSRIQRVTQKGNNFDFIDSQGRCIATGNINDNGLLHWNNVDTTKYSEVDSIDGATFIGANGKGADDSTIFSKDELRSYLEPVTGSVKGFDTLQPNEVSGSTLYGEQWARVEYDNDSYREIKVGYRGSGTWSDVPKGWTVDNTRNSKGEEVRVMYSDLKHRKPDQQEITPNPNTKTKNTNKTPAKPNKKQNKF